MSKHKDIVVHTDNVNFNKANVLFTVQEKDHKDYGRNSNSSLVITGQIPAIGRDKRWYKVLQ